MATSIQGDPHRPGYHFLPPRNWMNDPNGLIQFGGRYHLFFQHTPDAPVVGRSVWGHAVSDDLVRWRHLPHALEPTPGGYDNDGVWSGSAIDNGGMPTIFYTGVKPEVQCLATAADPRDPDLVRWVKHPGNPVISGHPPGLELDGFRDPYVWRHGDHWLMALGSGFKASRDGAPARGCVLLFRSSDLLHWDYLGPLAQGDGSDGTTWECPSFFPLGDRWVLTVAFYPLGRNNYFTGHFDGRRFTPEARGEIDEGGAFYAPQVFTDQRGRRIMFGWIWERRSTELCKSAGWAGVQTLPRELQLGVNGKVRFAPVHEVASLRGDQETVSDLVLHSRPHVLATAGDMLEVEATFALNARGDAISSASVPGMPGPSMGVLVRMSPSSSEVTRIEYHPTTAKVQIDSTHSSLEPGTSRDVRRETLTLDADEPLRLRVFVDRSVIEVYANDRVCLSGRVYPTREDSLGVGLFGPPGTWVSRCDVWRMAAANR